MNKTKSINRINNQIKNNVVKIVNIENGAKDFILSEALQLAKKQNLDLVEVAISNNISICKIIDYNKYLYNKAKKEKRNKKNQPTTKLKELRLSPNIADNDFNVKLSQAQKFLSEKNQVKIVLIFKGREKQYMDKGNLIVYEFIDKLKTFGKIDTLPQSNENKIIATIKPI